MEGKWSGVMETYDSSARTSMARGPIRFKAVGKEEKSEITLRKEMTSTSTPYYCSTSCTEPLIKVAMATGAE